MDAIADDKFNQAASLNHQQAKSPVQSVVVRLFATLAVRGLKVVIKDQLKERFPRAKATAVPAAASSSPA